MPYYAIRKGRKTGIFSSWAACQPHVLRFSGAEFKSFPTEDEAKAWLIQAPKSCRHSVKQLLGDGLHVAFVDGSFSCESGCWGYGCVYLLPDGSVTEWMGSGRSDKKSRNVTGELHGAMQAMRLACEYQAPSLVIFHDYQGIGAWADGDWECRLPLTQMYRKFVADARTKCEIRFQHVKGHSGVAENERADQLAAYAASYEITDQKVENGVNDALDV